MKVLLVAHIGFPWGGPTQRYYDLIESSFAQKIDLTFFESSPNRKSFSGAGVFNLHNIIDFWGMFFSFIVTLFRVRPTIVHIASTYGYSFLKHSILLITARLWGSKVILAPHCSISIFIPKPKLLFRWMQFILNQCDGMIVLSSEWASIKDIAPRPKIIHLKNSINLRRYLSLPRPVKKSHEEVQIIYLGHIGIDKGTMDLIQAVNILVQNGIHGYRVSIYGEDLHPGETNQAKNLTKSLSLQEIIFFCDPVFGDKKLEAYQKADIFVFPSHHEGMPISVIEAMAAGLPVIATKVGGIPDIIDHSRNGILIDPKAPGDLSKAITTLIENEQLRHSFGLEGRAKASENHDIEKYVENLLHFYQEIVSN